MIVSCSHGPRSCEEPSSERTISPEVVRSDFHNRMQAIFCSKGLFGRVVKVENLGPARLVKTKEEMFLVMFKREYYKSFQYHFPHIQKVGGGRYGYAQIMSESLLNKAFHYRVNWIVFIMPDKKAYRCHPKLFKKFFDEHQTRVPYLPGEIAMPLDYFERLGGQ